ncbi:MAG: UDP-N-acetylmuramoyl-L-alanine--D-glutamate ligase [Oscillospiraceae bacterium]|nr:UDP-N-acetylmuramoyl-L-alanine--D-glutamate ligase [Oscillospiraceae bacterium]
MNSSQYKKSIFGRTCAVLGLGVSNRPLVDFLLDAGAKVTVRDTKKPEHLGEFAAAFAERGVHFVSGAGYLDNITEDIIFRSPGIHPQLGGIPAAVAKGATLTSEMELFTALCPAKIIGITGSDGKTTTTTITHRILEASGVTAHVGGNIGTPLLPIVDSITPRDYVVLELSSFQLQTMKTSPQIAVVTNMSPNHLDWHADMGDYIAAKQNIFIHRDNGVLIINDDNPITRDFGELTSSGVVRFSAEKWLSDGVCVRDGRIFAMSEEIMSISEILLPGRHNLENYLAAIAATLGICTPAAIRHVAKTFGGVEHRLELIRRHRGVSYINSSIDSSPTRTAAALSAFNEKVIAICGGADKNLDFAPLAVTLSQRAKIVVLTGETAPKIQSELLALPENARPQIMLHPHFDDAVHAAADVATEGDTVILSPACTSFDQFENFAQRGLRFRRLIEELGDA